MASFLDKFKITTGIDTNTTLDLSCTHVTTSDWMHLQPVYSKEMVPGETLKIQMETFTRLAPLAVPTFGRGLIHNRAFFVPFRTVFDAWNEFITSADMNQDVQGPGQGSSFSTPFKVDKVPVIKNSTLVKLFTENSNSQVGNNAFATMITGNDLSSADIVLVDYNDNAQIGNVLEIGMNLTAAGRRMMKIIQSLGYQILWVRDDTAAGSYAGVDAEYSALPLLCWMRVVCDWYYPSQYVGDSVYVLAQAILSNHPTTSGVYEFTKNDLVSLFGNSLSPFNGLVNYDSDYFVSAFDDPTGTSQGSVSNGIVMPDINFNNNVTSSVEGSQGGNVGTINTSVTNGQVPIYGPHGIGGSNVAKQITQYGLDALKALTDYMKRHQLVGARALDRFYARFGKKLESAKFDRSMYLGSQNIPLQIGDVMSHSDTSGASLGAYAGKGIAYGADGIFEYSTDEYGLCLILSSIVPQIGYYQGINRNVMHIGRLDYWTPEFDQLGNQAIAKKELFVPMNTYAEAVRQGVDFVNADLIDGIFGYTPRYAEYKVGRDMLTGDYRYASINAAGDVSSSWHLMRNIGSYADDSTALKHSKKFVQGVDYNQYNRIFNNVENTADKFYMIHTFNVVSQSPMHSLYDTYKFENEDEGAQKVVADVNGVKVN